MKHIRYALLTTLLLAAFTFQSASAKEVVVPKMYMFAFAASFTDTIVYFSNVMEVDSVWIDSKNDFLIGRDTYSRQFREFLAEKKQMQNRTCVVFYGTKRQKVEKKYLKMKRLYTKSKDGKEHFDVRFLNDNEFNFRPFDVNIYIEAEKDRVQQAKEQEQLAKQQKAAAKQQKKEARKKRKEEKRNK
mgnify:CR=1 FL=1